jgi:hypothetical protein
MTAQVTSVKGGVTRSIEIMLRHGGYDSVLAYLAHSASRRGGSNRACPSCRRCAALP